MLDLAVIQAAWDTGHAAWPEITLEREQFAAHVREREPGAVAKYAADFYLAAACAAGDRTALAVFDREVIAHARPAIASIVKDDAFVDEASQRLRAHLFTGEQPRIADYEGRGPLRAWVGIAAARTALTMRRSQQRAKEVAYGDDWSGALASISTGDPELELLKRTYAGSFAAALTASVAALEPRLRAVLRMSFVEARSIDEIGAIYVVHRATAARWIQRACDEIQAATRDRLARELALTTSDLDRVAALVRSQLDVSLSQLLPASLD